MSPESAMGRDHSWSEVLSAATAAQRASRAGHPVRREPFYRHGMSRSGWAGPVVLLVLAIVFGGAGFRSGGNSWSDVAYRVVQLFVFEMETASSPPWEIEIARWAAALFVVWSVGLGLMRLSRDAIDRSRASRASGHTIVFGATETALAVAGEVLDRRTPVVVVVPADTDRTIVAGLRRRGAVVLCADSGDPATASDAQIGRADLVVAACADDGTNTSVSVSAFEAAHTSVRKSRLLRCFACIGNLELCKLVGESDLAVRMDDAFEFRVFNPHESAARLLWLDHLSQTLHRRNGARERAHLVIVGFGTMGEAVFERAVRMPHIDADRPLRITVIDRSAKLRLGLLRARLPAIDAIADVVAVDWELHNGHELRDLIETANRSGVPVGAVVICLQSVRLGLAAAMSVRALCASWKLPVYLRVTERSGLERVLEAGGAGANRAIMPFGTARECCSYEFVVHEGLDALAGAIHQRYREDEAHKHAEALASGRESRFSEAATRDWSHLPEDFRTSNRLAADHFAVKLAVLGKRLVAGAGAGDHSADAGGGPPGDAAPDELPPGDIEYAARLEHRRWCHEKRLAGCVGPDDDPPGTGTLRAQLRPWDRLMALDPPECNKDREQVRAVVRMLRELGWRIAPAARA